MSKGLDRVLGEDGLPVPPYALYNIGNHILSEELVRAGMLPEDYDFEAHKELVCGNLLSGIGIFICKTYTWKRYTVNEIHGWKY